MIVDDFNIVGITVTPNETNPPLVIDANGMLTFAIAVQRFQPVTGRGAKVRKRLSVVNLGQFPVPNLKDVLGVTFNVPAFPGCLGCCILE